MSVTQYVLNNQQINLQQIRSAKFHIQKIPKNCDSEISSAAISHNLKYIIVGDSDCELNIWNSQTRDRIKSLRFKNVVYSCKFTEDSLLLYVGIGFQLYQFYVNNNFKKLCKLDIDEYNENVGCINDIFCISNTIILTSFDEIIIKTDVNKKQQLLKIEAINNHSCGFDYHRNLNLIASGSAFGSILLWSGQNGTLRIEQIRAHNHFKHIFQVLFISDKNQLTSLDIAGNVIIWNLNFQTEQLEFLDKLTKLAKLVQIYHQSNNNNIQQQRVDNSLKLIQQWQNLQNNLTINLILLDFIIQFNMIV